MQLGIQHSPRGVEHESGPIGFHGSCDHSVEQSLLQQEHITWRERCTGVFNDAGGPVSALLPPPSK